jgi:hypothetical protein
VPYLHHLTEAAATQHGQQLKGGVEKHLAELGI